MATLPTSGTNIRLLSGVPFSSDYKNTRWFDDLSSQTTYFTSKNVVRNMGSATVQFDFMQNHGQFIRVDTRIDNLLSANYLMFQNAMYNSKWFYCFITHVEYVNPGMTKVYFELDVFQTWLFQLNFKPSFVVREHRPLWNGDGSPVINTQDEGLNYGSEYDTVWVDHYQPFDGFLWLVIVSKTPIEDDGSQKAEPNIAGMPQPLSIYFIPFKKDDETAVQVNTADGVFTPSTVRQTLKAIYNADNSVNNIVSLFITDHIGINVSYNSGTNSFDFITDPYTSVGKAVVTPTSGNAVSICMLNYAFNFTAQSPVITGKYDHYKSVTESKLLMYPYTQLILDDFKGNRATYKNEYINNNDLIVTLKGSVGVANKTSYGIADYNFNSSNLDNKYMVSDEFSLINNDPTDVPILNDNLAAFLQGNKNSLNVQRNAIAFNAVTGLVGGAIGAGAAAASRNVAGTAASVTSAVQGVGNSILRMQAIEAKQQDISNTPPQLAKMGANTSYTYGNGYTGVYLIKKQIKDEYIRKLTDFFNMFGYKTNEVKVPNFHTRQYWNYVQTENCIITGDFNNEDLQDLKNIFDQGITLWHTDDVGNYSLANAVIA